MSENQAISAAKAFAVDRGLQFEEPIFARALGGGQYQVSLAVRGASDPDVVINPPEFIFQVDLEKTEVTLIPSM